VNNKRIYTLGLGLLAVLLIGACSPTLSPSGETSPVSTPTDESQPTATQPAPSATPTAATSGVPAEAQSVVDQVTQDLAQKLDVDANTITVLSVKPVEWPDASLGCPQPGVMYIQVVTPGYEVRLGANGQDYSYHTGGGDFALCEPQLGVEPTGTLTATAPGPDATAAPLVDMAKQDLAQTLNVAPETIALLSVVEAQWRDSSLGCPKPGQNYLTVITPGYLIKLQAGGQTYEYHASRTNVVTCDNPQAPSSPQ
jgi:hypothetical protein